MENTKVAWAKEKIEHAIKQDGPYSHNICSMALMVVAEAGGEGAANQLIMEFDLTAIYGIQQAPERTDGTQDLRGRQVRRGGRR